ncbi:hypothetical protein ISS22_09880, partial [candidate division KSB1 bacterium]|nr:hypothetical protein [candidate division KSB1 bacterium]
MSTFGFHNPGGHEGKNYDIAFGDYRFTFDLPGSNDDTSFILDLRDADWTGNYSSPYSITSKVFVFCAKEFYYPEQLTLTTKRLRRRLRQSKVEDKRIKDF